MVYLVPDAASVLQSRLQTQPTVALIAGSGIMQAFRHVHIVATHPMADLPGIIPPSVEGHGSTLVECRIADVDVLLVTGRLHLYEGYRGEDVLRLVDVCHALGIRSLIITNATGGVNPRTNAGDVMIPNDAIDFTFQPLAMGRPKLPAPCHQWVQATLTRCWQEGIPVQTGTYVQVLGPSYETRAEIGLLRRMGADAVGMSTAIEAAYAASLGMQTLICSMITNTLTDTAIRHVTHSEVLTAATSALDTVARVCTLAVSTHAALSLPA